MKKEKKILHIILKIETAVKGSFFFRSDESMINKQKILVT